MARFYELSLEERVSLTNTAIGERRTLIERWAALESAEADAWNPRAIAAAAYLIDQSSVADFGCGTMTLHAFLRPDQIYIPLDVVKRDERTIICDLNLTLPPATGATSAALLGVVEYLHDPGPILRHLSTQYRIATISYCVTDAPEAPVERRAHAWVNSFDEAGAAHLFEVNGWRIERSTMVDALQRIWRLAAA